MTFTTLFSVLFGQRLAITERLAIQETFSVNQTSQIKTLILRIVAATFLIEFVGMFALFVYWTTNETFTSGGQTFFYAVFHAVAAFTHGSFALFPNSLINFGRDFFVLFVISTLIIAGGIGFPVGAELFDFVRRKSGFPAREKKRIRLSVQTKLTLITTLSLIIGGTMLIFSLERNGAFAAFSTVEALYNAYFFAVVPRTSGFNTVEMTSFSGATLQILIFLMFIGGTSGSTAGGIKTNTFGLLIASGFKRLRGEKRLNLFKRTIPDETVERAGAIVTASLGVVIFAVILLTITENAGGTASTSQAKFLPLLFETVSAFGTVGLSMGITPELTNFGKLILCAVMFIGRVGALSFGLSLALREPKADYGYAEENIMVG
jgi:trk system potassium uptake protein TrkH